MSGYYGCVLGSDEALTCWDASSTGGDEDLAAQVVAEGVYQMSVGSDAVCWTGSGDVADCLALSEETSVALPDRGGGAEVASFAVATYYACVVYQDGSGACASAPDAHEVPTEVSSLFKAPELAFTDAGNTSTCVIDRLGHLACAGARDDCDTDDGMVTGPCIDDWNPSGSWRDVATYDSTCAVGADGTITCHGDTCAAPEGNDYVRVALASPSVCGLHADGQLSCVVDISGRSDDGAPDCEPGHPEALEAARCDNADAIFGGGPC